MDLVLTVGAGLDGAGGADFVSRPWERMRSQSLADIDRGQPWQRDPLRIADHEVRIAVAIRIDPLDVDDPTDRFPAGRVAWGAVGRCGRGGGEN